MGYHSWEYPTRQGHQEEETKGGDDLCLEWPCERGLEGGEQRQAQEPQPIIDFNTCIYTGGSKESQPRGSHKERLSREVSEEKVFPKCYLTLEVQLRLFFERGVAASDKEQKGEIKESSIVGPWRWKKQRAPIWGGAILSQHSALDPS